MAQHATTSKMPRQTHRFAVRYMDHWLPSGRRTKFNNQHDNDRCPLCGKPDEASFHFLKCHHKAMEKCFRDLIENLHQTMLKAETLHAPTGKILMNLQQWRRQEENHIIIRNGDMNEMGFENFLHGRVAANLRDRN